jgi:hypothetical protein
VTTNGIASIAHQFIDLENAHLKSAKIPRLFDVLTIGHCAVVCGAEHFTEMSARR